jgi:hypothetical protein
MWRSTSRLFLSESPCQEHRRHLQPEHERRAAIFHPSLSQMNLSGRRKAISREPMPCNGHHILPIPATSSTRVGGQEQQRSNLPPSPSGAETSGPTLHGQASYLQCPTVARFDYMSQARAGPHSWLSDRLLLMTIGTYTTIILVLVCIILYEDHFSSLPSS